MVHIIISLAQYSINNGDQLKEKCDEEKAMQTRLQMAEREHFI